MKTLPFTPYARPAVIVPLLGQTLEDLQRLADLARETPGVDAVEWRVDALLTGFGHPFVDPGEYGDGGTYVPGVYELTEAQLPDPSLYAEALEVVRTAELPVLTTLRTLREGGRVAFADPSAVTDAIDDESEDRVYAPSAASDLYAKVVQQLIDTRPDAIDIELARTGSEGLIGRARDRGVISVVSSHDWHGTPPFSAQMSKLQQMAALGADVAKLAVTAHSKDDALDLLAVTAAADDELDIPVIGVSMGEYGRSLRVIGSDFGSVATFAVLEESSAPGQLRVRELRAALDAISTATQQQAED